MKPNEIVVKLAVARSKITHVRLLNILSCHHEASIRSRVHSRSVRMLVRSELSFGEEVPGMCRNVGCEISCIDKQLPCGILSRSVHGCNVDDKDLWLMVTGRHSLIR
jgi:hypothetical protein